MVEKKQKDSKEQTSQQIPKEDAKVLRDEQQEKIDEYTNQLKRVQAEFENYMKRTQKEQQHVSDYAVERFIAKLLTIMDDFEHTIAHMQQASREEVIQGVQMIFGKLHKLLTEEHIMPIETHGKPFDPHCHEVLLFEETDAVPENTVVQELQKGYLHKDHVIRCAKVKIAKAKKTSIGGK